MFNKPVIYFTSDKLPRALAILISTTSLRTFAFGKFHPLFECRLPSLLVWFRHYLIICMRSRLICRLVVIVIKYGRIFLFGRRWHGRFENRWSGWKRDELKFKEIFSCFFLCYAWSDKLLWYRLIHTFGHSLLFWVSFLIHYFILFFLFLFFLYLNFILFYRLFR